MSQRGALAAAVGVWWVGGVAMNGMDLLEYPSSADMY